MKKGILCITLAAGILFGGCSNKNLNKAEITDTGFIDKKTGITYVSCSVLAVRPVTVENEYADDGERIYYTIKWEDPKKLLCDKEDGLSFVYRAESEEEISLGSFEPISANIFAEGKSSVFVGQLFCEQKYLDDEDKNENLPDDSKVIYTIRDAALNDEAVSLPADKNIEDQFFIRLLSQKYPGLYYIVIYTAYEGGEYYLTDRGSGKTVKAPENVVERMSVHG